MSKIEHNIIFGDGNIGIGVCEYKNNYGISFEKLDQQLSLGTIIPLSEENINNLFPIILTFKNEKAIDIFITKLEYLRECIKEEKCTQL